MTGWRLLLVYIHRYLGILLSLCFLLWFISGFVIIYTGGMPRITEAERLQHLPVIDFNAIRIGPRQAQAQLNVGSLPTLTTVMGRPAYRFGPAQLVFADSGETLSTANISSQQIAADFLHIAPDRVRRLGTVDQVDQWTLGLRGELPLEKYSAADDKGSEIYVSRASATVRLHTTSRDRLLAWLGAIPHWFYFVQLRRDGELWSRVVVWSASLATLLAVAGLVLLLTQLRWQRLPKLQAAIPYRGLMRWHYITAFVFGLFVTTWVFSGLLSMEPYRWTRQSGLTLDFASYRGELQAAPGFDQFDLQRFWRSVGQGFTDNPVKEIGFNSFANRSFLELTVEASDSSWQHETVIVSAEPPFASMPLMNAETLVTRLQAATTAEVTEAERLDAYDHYYYGRDSSDGPSPPLPVLRVSFNDADDSVFYIDLQSGEPVSRSHRWSRLERWLYRGLHSLDFRAFYRWRPLWDVVLILLLAGGLLVTLLGTILGVRRLRRGL